jgi:hypothetical protein
MKIAEAPGKAVGLSESPIRNMFKKHIINVPFGPVRNDAAKGTARLNSGFLYFKKIDMPVDRH